MYIIKLTLYQHHYFVDYIRVIDVGMFELIMRTSTDKV